MGYGSFGGFLYVFKKSSSKPPPRRQNTHVAMVSATLFKTARFGFTLAEVLITLGIIGVVAAIIMPNIINDIRNNRLKAQFKVAHSLVTNAVSRMGMDDTDIVDTNCGYNVYQEKSMVNFNTQFANYFDGANIIIKRGGYSSALSAHLGYKNQNEIKTVSNKSVLNYYLLNGRPIVLKNGMIIITSGSCQRDGKTYGTPRPVGFLVDINGNKEPNRIGFDIFDFQILRGNRLNTANLDYTKSQTGQTPTTSDCDYTTGTNSRQGFSCTLYAVMDKSPTDESKSYWKNLPRK